jgi:hypothetical protein
MARPVCISTPLPPRGSGRTFDCMRTGGLFLCIALLLLVTGCVPLGHSSLVAPTASGQVLDLGTLKSITHAKITRRIQAVDKTSTITTDDMGSFSFPKRSKWFWFAGCRAASPVEYCVSADGYRDFQTNLYGGGDFHRGTVPHDLGRILLPRAAQ